MAPIVAWNLLFNAKHCRLLNRTSRRISNFVFYSTNTRFLKEAKGEYPTNLLEEQEGDFEGASDGWNNDEGRLITRRERHTSHKFVDMAIIEVRGGRGGNGCVSFEVLAPGKKRPSGGNGGKGGDVYIVSDKRLTSMSFETFHFNAGDGRHGGSDGITGRSGKDVFIRVPPGTIITERMTDDLWMGLESEGFDPDEATKCIDLGEEALRLKERTGVSGGSVTVLVAKGGQPGIGNAMMAGSKMQRARSLPASRIPGQPGQHRSLILELKLIADVGLVGFPNAGKSTLLNALSNARPKIAAYPFTTLHPSVGVVEYSDAERVTVADIPGLIDGASENRGLGHAFLKHIERTKLLLYVVDGPGSEGRNPVDDLKCLFKELKLYNPDLLKKPSLIFANKVETLDATPELLAKHPLSKLAKARGIDIIWGSAKDGIALMDLTTKLRHMILG